MQGKKNLFFLFNQWQKNVAFPSHSLTLRSQLFNKERRNIFSFQISTNKTSWRRRRRSGFNAVSIFLVSFSSRASQKSSKALPDLDELFSNVTLDMGGSKSNTDKHNKDLYLSNDGETKVNQPHKVEDQKMILYGCKQNSSKRGEAEEIGLFAEKKTSRKTPTILNQTKVRSGQVDIPFEYNGKINWYPGHMRKATNIMHENIKRCDYIVEIRDTRLPFSSANPMLEQLATTKPRLILFNKVDLADSSKTAKLEEYYQRQNDSFQYAPTNIIYTCLDNNHKTKIKLLNNNKKKQKFSKQKMREDSINGIMKWIMKTGDMKQVFKTVGNLIMVCGMPNVGKSTFINKMREYAHKRNRNGGRIVAQVGEKAGVTRNVSHNIKVSQNPLIYLMDTPGIMLPNLYCLQNSKRIQHKQIQSDRSNFMKTKRRQLNDQELGLKLALCGIISDKVVEGDVLIQYMLYQLSKNDNSNLSTFKATLGVPEFTTFFCLEDIYETVLVQSGAMGKQDANAKAICIEYLLTMFRYGHFGHITLDNIPSVEYGH